MRQVRNARFIGRFQLPAPVESCLWTGEITALREIVAAYDAGRSTDAYVRAPGFVRLARAYLWLLAWNERHREMVARALAVGEG